MASDASHSSLFDSVSSRYTTIVAGKDFPYYSQSIRIQALTDLIRSVESDYSLLSYKERSLGIDVQKLGDEAVQAESGYPDVLTDPEQAAGNMEFLDRVKRLMAGLKDTHFSVHASAPLAPTVLGIDVAKVRGRFIISSIRTPLLKDAKGISLGDELVSIDGRAPQDAIDELQPYIPASSALFGEMQATKSLTARDFLLPKRGSSSVVIRHGGSTASMDLPWYALDVQRTDEAIYLQSHGVAIPGPDDLKSMTGTPDPRNLDMAALVQNEDWLTRINGLENETDFVSVDDPDSTVISAGVLKGPAGPAAFLQIQSFNAGYLIERPDESDSSVGQHVFPFSDLVKSLVAGIKQNSLPLILDLRKNPGGNLDYALQLFSDLAESGKQYAPLSAMFRITMLSWASEDAASPKGLKVKKVVELQQAMDDAFKNAIAQHRDYSEVLPADPLRADSDIGGYSGKVVALISPYCVSACDALALLLKTSGRAVLLGESSNGTGAGFFSSFSVPEWTDSNHILTAQVPNMLFGRPLKPGESPATVDIESIEAENRPTMPDVSHETTVEDVLSGNSDLIQAALSSLGSGQKLR